MIARSNPIVLGRQEVIRERVRADIARENNLGASSIESDKAASMVDTTTET